MYEDYKKNAKVHGLATKKDGLSLEAQGVCKNVMTLDSCTFCQNVHFFLIFI